MRNKKDKHQLIENKSFLQKYGNKIVLLLIIFAGILYFSSLNSYFWVDGDNVAYSLLARSILNGEYLRIQYMTKPPDINYWPGFPLMLAIPTLIAEDNIILLKFIPAICLLIALIFFYKYVKLTLGKKWAFLGLFLCVINPSIYLFSHTILAQTPFLMALMLSLYFSGKFVREKKSIKSKEFFWMVFAAILAKYIRAEGDFLMLFIFIYLLLRKRIKPAFCFLGSYVIITGIWIIRNKLAYQYASKFQKKYFLTVSRAANILWKGVYDTNLVTFKELISRFFKGIQIYFGQIIPAKVFGMQFMVNKIFWTILTIALTLHGFVLSLKLNKVKKIKVCIKDILSKVTPMHLYFLFGLLLVFLAIGKSEKYLYPVIPFIIIFIFLSLANIIKLLKIKNVILILGIILIIFSYFNIKKTMVYHKKERSQRYYGPVFAHYVELAKWFGKNFPKGTKVMARKPGFFYWHSKRTAKPFLYDKTPEENITLINDLDIDYIIVTETGFDYGTNPGLFKMINQFKSFFKIKHSGYVPNTNNQRKYFILEVLKEPIKTYLKKG